ncbi:MAG TPA: hypothetical protein VFG86_05470, partial [Chloroflexota bacterium]|nr:hypothetical protein [Chloroflexota bacterium]
MIIYDPSLPMHSTTFEVCTGSEGLQVDLHDGGFANVWLGGEMATVGFANVTKQIVQLPTDASVFAGVVLLIERDQDGMF